MREDPSSLIVAGVKKYLGEHFPEIDFMEQPDSRSTGSVLLVGGPEGGYRLALTETFLEGQQGSDKPLERIRQWNVARALRDSGGWLVVLTAEGIRLEG